MDSLNKEQYLQELKRRQGKKQITQNFQFIGLEVANLLHDFKHKALYIKLAKEFGADKILALAKDVAERRNIANPGAYFMSIIKELRNKK